MVQQPPVGPQPPVGQGLLIIEASRSHSDIHYTVGRTPLDEGSAPHRDLYLTTQTLYKTNIHAPGGIRTHDPSKRAAADPSLRPRGHWDRFTNVTAVHYSACVCIKRKPNYF
jgi:hypothetical protein